MLVKGLKELSLHWAWVYGAEEGKKCFLNNFPQLTIIYCLFNALAYKHIAIHIVKTKL